MKKALIILALLVVAGIIARIYTNQVSQTPESEKTVTAPTALQTLCERNGRIWNTESEMCESASE